MGEESVADIDTHDPSGMAAFLRERAKANREVAALPFDQWPHRPDVLRHWGLRFDQAAQMIETVERSRLDASNDANRLAIRVTELTAERDSLKGLADDTSSALQLVIAQRDQLQRDIESGFMQGAYARLSNLQRAEAGRDRMRTHLEQLHETSRAFFAVPAGERTADTFEALEQLLYRIEAMLADAKAAA
jgi:hypothetical protein